MTAKKATFGNQVLEFYKTLTPPTIRVKGIKVIEPHKNEEIRGYMEKFFNKFFHDTKKRVFVIGINAGRLGSGTTGIPFTDPVELENSCGIANTLAKRREMSSEFLYKFIAKWGNARTFYKDFFFTGMLPLGLVRDGKNCNYYESPKLLSAVKPFMVETLIKQFAFGAKEEAVIILGSGKNQKVFKELNKEHGWFKTVYVLEHPRFIAQYHSKDLKKYLKKYQDTFSQALSQI